MIPLRLLFIALLVVFACEDEEADSKFDFPLIDLNPNSSTFEQTVGPADFLGDICIVFFGHES